MSSTPRPSAPVSTLPDEGAPLRAPRTDIAPGEGPAAEVAGLVDDRARDDDAAGAGDGRHDGHRNGKHDGHEDGEAAVPTPTDPVVLRAEIAETRAALAETVALLAAKTDVKARAKDGAADLVAAAKDRARDARVSMATLSDRVTAKIPTRDAGTGSGGDLGDAFEPGGAASGWRVHPMVLPSILLGISGALFGAAAVVARRARR